MERKARLQKIGIVLLFLGTAALGIIVGLYLFMTNPDLLPLPDPEPSATPIPAAQPTSPPAWNVTFEYRFTVSEWASGPYSYQLRVSCPGSGTGDWSSTFQVSSSAPRRNERVYLRTQGPMDQPTGGNVVAAVHPQQALGAAVTLSYPTLDEAEAARQDCTAQVRVGSGQLQRMDPRIPTQDDG